MLLTIMQHGAACIRCLKKGCCRHKCSPGNLQCMLLAFSVLGLEVLQCDMEAIHILLRPLVKCMLLCSMIVIRRIQTDAAATCRICCH